MMAPAVVQKELRAILRDGRFVVLAISLSLLLAGLLFASAQQQRRLAQEKAEVSALVRQQWDSQGDKHPHRGAHFGLYAFRPDSPLAVVDPGLGPYLGQALWLEPHRRNMTRFRPAADEPPSVRFGALTPAFVLVALLPLLIFALAFNAVSLERESGTLRMLHSVGLPGRTLLAGKLVALLAVVSLVLLAAVGAGLALAAAGTWPDADALWRGAVLAGACLVYCSVFAALALAVSARLANSRRALFVLLALWLAFVFVVPRLGAASVQRAVPLPTAERFWGDIQRDYAEGLPGDGALAARTQRFDAELLRRHAVRRLEDLPFGAYALRRMDRDAYADRVHAIHFDGLWERYARQERVVRIAAAFSPTVAMRAISMKLSGTDLAHQRHFEEAAEQYRRRVNVKIDQWDVDHTRGLTSFDEKYAGDALWRSADAFDYRPPDVVFALRAALPDLGVLLAWAVAACGLLGLAARRLQP
jgi:ABC-2 type transport system permease protein